MARRIVGRDTRLQLFGREADAIEHAVVLALGALLRLGENHLAARERMHLGIALELERRVEQVGMLADHRRHGADAHGVRHARIRRQLADHVRLLLLMRPQRLADQHVAFAAAQAAVEIGRREPAQLVLIRQSVRHAAHGPAHAAVGPAQQALSHADAGELEPRVAIDADVILGVLPGKAQQVVDPDRDRRGVDLRALGFEPAMDVVVRRALDGLDVELAGELHHRLDAQAIDFDAHRSGGAPRAWRW